MIVSKIVTRNRDHNEVCYQDPSSYHILLMSNLIFSAVLIFCLRSYISRQQTKIHRRVFHLHSTSCYSSRQRQHTVTFFRGGTACLRNIQLVVFERWNCVPEEYAAGSFVPNRAALLLGKPAIVVRGPINIATPLIDTRSGGRPAFARGHVVTR